jgi:hypothetical protein
MSWGDLSDPRLLRVYLDWHSVRYPAMWDAVAAVGEASRVLRRAGNVIAWVVGPPPEDAWAGYCWVTVASGLTWLDKMVGMPRVAGLTTDLMSRPAWSMHARRGAVVTDDSCPDAVGLGKLVAHELTHCVGNPYRHEWGDGSAGYDEELCVQGIADAVAELNKWRD